MRRGTRLWSAVVGTAVTLLTVVAASSGVAASRAEVGYTSTTACAFERLPGSWVFPAVMSADGSHVLYRDGGGGTPATVERLADGTTWTLPTAGVGNTSFDPTGEHLVFTSTADLDPDRPNDTGTAQLFVLEVQTGAVRRLTDERPDRVVQVDGSRVIVFGPPPDGSGADDTPSTLWSIDLASAAVTALPDVGPITYGGSFSDDASVNAELQVDLRPAPGAAGTPGATESRAPTTVHYAWSLVLHRVGEQPEVLVHDDAEVGSSHSYIYSTPTATLDPDGSHLLFFSDRGPDGAEGPWRLWRYELADETWTPLTDPVFSTGLPTTFLFTTEDGRHVHLGAAGDPLGTNPTGRQQVFATGPFGALRQLTAATGESYLGLAGASDDGTRLLISTGEALDGGAPVDVGAHFVATCPLYRDVPPHHQFFDAVTWADTSGVTTGYPDGGFHPASPVTRAAFVTFLHRLADEPAPAGPPAFDDVSSDHPFADAIAWAQETGAVQGWPDGTFRPQRTVSRGALAAVLHQHAGNPAPTGAATFSDVAPEHPQHDAIAWAEQQGYVQGYADGTYRSGAGVTRQAVVAILERWSLDQA